MTSESRHQDGPEPDDAAQNGPVHGAPVAYGSPTFPAPMTEFPPEAGHPGDPGIPPPSYPSSGVYSLSTDAGQGAYGTADTGYGSPAGGDSPYPAPPAPGAYGSPAAAESAYAPPPAPGAYGSPAASDSPYPAPPGPGAYGSPAAAESAYAPPPAAGAYGSPAASESAYPAPPSFNAYGSPAADSYGSPSAGSYGSPAAGDSAYPPPPAAYRPPSPVQPLAGYSEQPETPYPPQSSAYPEPPAAYASPVPPPAYLPAAAPPPPLPPTSGAPTSGPPTSGPPSVGPSVPQPRAPYEAPPGYARASVAPSSGAGSEFGAGSDFRPASASGAEFRPGPDGIVVPDFGANSTPFPGFTPASSAPAAPPSGTSGFAPPQHNQPPAPEPRSAPPGYPQAAAGPGPGGPGQREQSERGQWPGDSGTPGQPPAPVGPPGPVGQGSDGSGRGAAPARGVSASASVPTASRVSPYPEQPVPPAAAAPEPRVYGRPAGSTPGAPANGATPNVYGTPPSMPPPAPASTPPEAPASGRTSPPPGYTKVQVGVRPDGSPQPPEPQRGGQPPYGGPFAPPHAGPDAMHQQQMGTTYGAARPAGAPMGSGPAPGRADQDRFNAFTTGAGAAAGAQPKVPDQVAAPKTVRLPLAILGIVGAAALLLIMAFGITWVATRPGTPAFEVGSCVRESGKQAVKAGCGDAGAFTVVQKVDKLEQCTDPKQPYVVVPASKGKQEVLCLRPASAK